MSTSVSCTVEWQAELKRTCTGELLRCAPHQDLQLDCATAAPPRPAIVSDITSLSGGAAARSGRLRGGAPGPLARGPRAAAALPGAVHDLQRRRQPGHAPGHLGQGARHLPTFGEPVPSFRVLGDMRTAGCSTDLSAPASDSCWVIMSGVSLHVAGHIGPDDANVLAGDSSVLQSRGQLASAVHVTPCCLKHARRARAR